MFVSETVPLKLERLPTAFFVLMVAYAFSCCRFKSRRLLQNLSVTVNLFPGVLAMIAVYFVLRYLNLTNSYAGLIMVYGRHPGGGLPLRILQLLPRGGRRPGRERPGQLSGVRGGWSLCGHRRHHHPRVLHQVHPAYFQDDNGDYIYGIAGGPDGEELYDAIQEAVDAASAEADYVIALGHLGVDESS